MAASDVLQFNCSVENEVARNATKDFAGMLGKAFEQYKKLWNEYLMLRKYCEDVDVKIPFQVLESDSYQNKNINILSEMNTHCIEPVNKHPTQEPESTKVPLSTCESVSNVGTSDDTCDDTCDFDNYNTVLSDNKSSQKRMNEDELLKSPVLVKRRKSRKSNVMPNYMSLDDSEEHNPCIPIKNNFSVMKNNSEQDMLEMSIESKETERSFIEDNDQIECTPISKVSKKLGVSKLYNINTTLLQSGKKLRQSKLVFLPLEQNTDNTAYKTHKASPLKPHTSPIPERNIIENSKNQVISTDEEIIESSPNKCTESNLRVKSLKLKERGLVKSLRKGSAFGKVESEISDTKLPTGKINEMSASQYLPCTQKDESYLIKKSKTFGSSCSTGSNCDSSNSFHTPVFGKAEDLCFDDTAFDINLSTPVKEAKKAQVAENNQVQKTEFLDSTNQTLNCNSSAYNDETYCDLGELKKDVCKSNMLPPSPPVKKSLLSSFNIPSGKKDISPCKSSKSKSERAKMSGISCWECKQYYANLGLLEDEIKAKQNQCSRHRTKYNEEQDTPDGFWDPLFPDTFSSTFQD